MPSRYTEPTILMCPPDHYGIEYEINGWMSRSRPADPIIARAQWDELVQRITSLGAQIEYQPAVAGLPDLVFTANAGLVRGNDVFLSQFRHPARQGETVHDEAWFLEHGFQTVHLPEGLEFEGAGDALFCGPTLFAGYRMRSSAPAMQWVAAQIGCRVIPLQLLSDRFYHLDTCFCPLDSETAIYHKAAFDQYALDALAAHVPRLIPVEPDEAARFACNAVVIGSNVITNTGCPKLHEELASFGFIPHEVALDEYLKSGGSAKCLTLRLDGEDAAKESSSLAG